MSSRTPEYEQEVVRTLRLVRGLIYAVMGIAAAFALFAVLAFVLSVTVSSSSGGSPNVRHAGIDMHAPLKAESTLGNTTESGLFAEVTIQAVRRDSRLTVTASVRGMNATAALPETWKLYLTDNTQQPMQVEVLETTRDGVTIRASLEIPAGKTPQFLHVDPDASHGDLYFDIPPG
jgi:hypothetical protein